MKSNFVQRLSAAVPAAFSFSDPQPVLVKLLNNVTSSSHSDGKGCCGSEINASVDIIVKVGLMALFFLCFFAIYLRRCGGENSSNFSILNRRGGVDAVEDDDRHANADAGLNAGVIESFPVFTYALVKGLRTNTKNVTDCAVCLNDFEDDMHLRLLPKCGHAFHPECIDMWLFSHSTCPLCRTDLLPTDMTKPTGASFRVIEPIDNVPRTDETHSQQIPNFSGSGRSSDRRGFDANTEPSLHGNEYTGHSETIETQQVIQLPEDQVQNYDSLGQGHLTRSNSTGHSVLLLRRGMEMGESNSEWFISTPRGLQRATHLSCRFAKVPLDSQSQGFSPSFLLSKFRLLQNFGALNYLGIGTGNGNGNGASSATRGNFSGSGRNRRSYEPPTRLEHAWRTAELCTLPRSRSEHRPPCVFNPAGSASHVVTVEAEAGTSNNNNNNMNSGSNIRNP